jgi:hypothetical protein
MPLYLPLYPLVVARTFFGSMVTTIGGRNWVTGGVSIEFKKTTVTIVHLELKL